MTKWHHTALANLTEILANLYPYETDTRRIAAKAGLRTAFVDFSGASIDRWFKILTFADAHSRVDSVVECAIEENPNDEALIQARRGAPPRALKGPEPTQWNGPSLTSSLEKIMGGKSTLVPIAYLEIGVERAKSVARVKRDDGSSGTGFVVQDNLLITNNHVLPNIEAAKSSIIQFNYQQTAAGLSAVVEEVRLLPESFFRTSSRDDWTAVKIEGDAIKKWGALALKPTTVKPGDHVNIVQHPGGGPKQTSLFANVVVFVGESRIQYLTDTLPGSSGSPVFDAQWNVIALHHSGGWLSEENAPKKTTYYRNEGISIQRIIAGLVP